MRAIHWTAITRWDGEGHAQSNFRYPDQAIGHMMDIGTEGYQLSGWTHTVRGDDEEVERPSADMLQRMEEGEQFVAYHRPTGHKAKPRYAAVTVTLKADNWT